MNWKIYLVGGLMLVCLLIGTLFGRYTVKPITPKAIVASTLDQAQAQLAAQWAKTLLQPTNPVILEKTVIKTWYGGTKTKVVEKPVIQVVKEIQQVQVEHGNSAALADCLDALGRVQCPPPSLPRVSKWLWDAGIGENVNDAGIVRTQVRGEVTPAQINIFHGRAALYAKVGGDIFYNPGASQINGDGYFLVGIKGNGK